MKSKVWLALAALAIIAVAKAEPDTAPQIVTQPEDDAVYIKSIVSFSVTATGASPLSYQWRKNGVALAGGTKSMFKIYSALPPQQGHTR